MVLFDPCETIKDGWWEDPTVWDGGHVPDTTFPSSQYDIDVTIKHNIRIGNGGGSQLLGAHTVKSITIDGTMPNAGLWLDTSFWDAGWSLSVTDGITYKTSVNRFMGTVRLAGFKFDVGVPSITGDAYNNDPLDPVYYPHHIYGLAQNAARDIIIEDPGQPLATYRLQDITPEGNAKAYARKIGNGVRSMTVGVRIRASKPEPLGFLYNMAEQGFQVLACTGTSIIKGHIETIAPDASSVGKEYISLKVTIVEGQ